MLKGIEVINQWRDRIHLRKWRWWQRRFIDYMTTNSILILTRILLSRVLFSGDRHLDKMPCKFPFHYDGKDYENCIKENSVNWWCSVVDYFGPNTWRDCTEGNLPTEAINVIVHVRVNSEKRSDDASFRNLIQYGFTKITSVITTAYNVQHPHKRMHAS